MKNLIQYKRNETIDTLCANPKCFSDNWIDRNDFGFCVVVPDDMSEKIENYTNKTGEIIFCCSKSCCESILKKAE